MKRSEINCSIDGAIEFFQKMSCPLPGYAFWSPEDWLRKGSEYDEIRDLGLGWDVTDFGSGDLSRFGRTIFTLRNGSLKDARYPKCYAHKVMYLVAGQKSVVHCHRNKREDIINAGGGNILIAVWSSAPEGGLIEAPVEVALSGRRLTQPPGEPVVVKPGESLCLNPLVYHQFWAEEGGEHVLSMEVSSVCDDYTDNIFLEAGERFPLIEEDEPRRYVLCHEYPPGSVPSAMD